MHDTSRWPIERSSQRLLSPTKDTHTPNKWRRAHEAWRTWTRFRPRVPFDCLTGGHDCRVCASVGSLEICGNQNLKND